MKIKEGLEISTSEFWYDLTEGGYLHPEDILEHQNDIDKVLNAIEVIKEFEMSCEEQIEDFYQ